MEPLFKISILDQINVLSAELRPVLQYLMANPKKLSSLV